MFENLQTIERADIMNGGSLQTLNIARRDILKIGLAGLLASVVPLLSTRKALAAAPSSAWRISFKNTHTGENFSGVYRVGDRYLPEAFERMNYVLRDFRTHEVFPMDPRAIDLLSIIQRKIGRNKPMEVLSGYRSPKTNAMLREASTRVAKNSLHMYGQAIDIRQTGYSTSKIRNIARGLGAGGVGYYRRSDFVHIDTGQIRSW